MINRVLCTSLFCFTCLAVSAAVLAGCPTPGAAVNLAAVIVGTWELHQGGTITFNADATFMTSEGTEGAYQVVERSVVLDIDDIDGELNQVLTYLGRFPDGRLLFSQETPLGLSRVEG
jgi:hypothetical protein